MTLGGTRVGSFITVIPQTTSITSCLMQSFRQRHGCGGTPISNGGGGGCTTSSVGYRRTRFGGGGGGCCDHGRG